MTTNKLVIIDAALKCKVCGFQNPDDPQPLLQLFNPGQMWNVEICEKCLRQMWAQMCQSHRVEKDSPAAEVLELLDSHIRQMAPHVRERYTAKLMIEARAQLERLLDGAFTADELQSVCPNLGPEDVPAFVRGCYKHWLKMFDVDATRLALAQILADDGYTIVPKEMTGGDLDSVEQFEIESKPMDDEDREHRATTILWDDDYKP